MLEDRNGLSLQLVTAVTGATVPHISNILRDPGLGRTGDLAILPKAWGSGRFKVYRLESVIEVLTI